MSTVIMYWDRIDPLGDPIAGIEILNNNHAVEIPPEACGFRLGLPGEAWSEAWYFAQPGGLGAPFEAAGIEYSSTFIGTPSPDAIEARGPVHGCSSGEYRFQTPLGALGIAGSDPVFAGAGAFVADFTSEDDIEWLDSAGKAVKVPTISRPKPSKLPEDFFEKPPNVRGCFRDFDGNLHCPKAADTAAMQLGMNALTLSRALPPPRMAMLVAAGSGILPQVTQISAPTGGVNDTPQGKVEVHCPAELVLTATFFKDPTFEAATVEYRFRFAHGPVSTVFSTLVHKEGANAVFHSVPIPLPRPVGQTPSGGGVTTGPVELAVSVKPEDPPFGGGSPVASQTFVAEALPDNEHKSSVRVEVINAFEGVVSSGWATYHLVCAAASSRPKLRKGARGVAVVGLQSGLNKWLRARQMPLLSVDGVFGARTAEAISAFQTEQGLAVDGAADERTWSGLLNL